MGTSPASSGPPEGRTPEESRRRGPPLVLFMLLAVATVGALSFLDEERESDSALEDFAQEQAVLASSIASELSTRLSIVRRDALLLAQSDEEGWRAPATALDGYTGYRVHAAQAPAEASSRNAGDGFSLSVPVTGGRVIDLAVPPVKLLEGAMRIERPGAVRLLILGPDGHALHGTDGHVVENDGLRGAIGAGQSSVWLERADAAALGLPERRAAAGLARVDAGPLGRWAVAVVSSAERERDREHRARLRLALSVLLAAGLVSAFGTVALRKQRRELLLERELALADLARERDERLAIASKTAMMGTLAMGIAHEVSTPLGVIAGRAEQLLPRVEGDERSSRAVQAIVEQADRIRRVVRGFLDLARGGAPALDDVQPSAILGRAVSLVEHRFANARVMLTTDIPEGMPTLRCDVPMLEQALVNLLLNACDACSRGGRVEALVRADAGRVAFVVVDDGKGITPEEAARATEPFFTTKPSAQGTGLGLAIASEIVKMHRGSLSIEPASPRGTRASLFVPIPKAEVHVAA